MARTVLFLGAGASDGTGAPLIANFVPAIEAAHAAGVLVPGDYAGFRQLRGAALATGANADDIEVLLDVAGHRGPEDLQALAAVMADTLEARISFEIHGGMARPTHGAYSLLANKLRNTANPSRAVAIITVNYDVCAEVAVYASGRRPYYCLNPRRGARSDEVTVAKLHGSLNWHGCAGYNCGYVNAEPHIDDFAREHLTSLADGAVSTLRFRSRYPTRVHSCGREEQQPLIVPPVEDKSNYYGDMRTVWDHAEAESHEAEQLLIAGYSWRLIDGAVNNLLCGAVAGRPVRVVVSNPSDDARARTIAQLQSATPTADFVERNSFLSGLQGCNF